MISLLGDLVTQPQKFDCLKHPLILQLESLEYSPFHLVSLILFFLAIVHTLSVHLVRSWAKSLETRQATTRKREKSVLVQILYLLSEVEIIFAFWAVPLFISMVATFGWKIALEYMNTRDYTEAIFVTVLLAIASTRPIVNFAEKTIRECAKMLGGSLSAWWFTLLTVGPILGSLITEVGAMILCALLFSRQFFEYRPSWELSYATVGLLFVNISIGGILTDFASPAVLILSNAWHWTLPHMFLQFGWKAILGIFISNLLYLFLFRREFRQLNERKKELQLFRSLHPLKEEEAAIPRWIAFVHLLFIACIVMVSHYPAIFIALFFFFIAFHQTTRGHQSAIRLTRPSLVGLFLAGLIIHVGLQGWWVAKILNSLTPKGVLLAAILMTGFNDNAAISYLGTLVPGWHEAYRYA
ncbi:MAG TPA: putative Na+/H+ antiporter, partial [Chlamydiales bacterium]|nr:putative Na+/H+ antiporter [Chlamydiales bacterium]